MMVPQPTAQYGHVERVSLARAIFSVRSCANAGFKSKPNTAAAAPPMVVNFRKSRRAGGLQTDPPRAQEGQGGGAPRQVPYRNFGAACPKKLFNILRAPPPSAPALFRPFPSPAQP